MLLRQCVLCVDMRKLVIAALSFSAAVFAANTILSIKLSPFLAALFLILGASLLLLRRKWLRGLVICLFSLSVGLGCFGLHYLLTTVPAHKFDGQTLQLSATVMSYPRQAEDYSSAEIKLNERPGLRVLLYDRSGSLDGLEPGTVISGEFKLSSADVRYGKAYDYYNAKDIYLIANTAGSLRASAGEGISLSCLAERLNRMLCEKVDEIFPEDTAHFMKSMLLGDRTDLYQDEALYAALQDSGVSHIVAVSGLHVAFLVGLIQLFLGVSPRSSLLCLVLVWCFVLVTGAPPSAIRAGIMQSFLLLAPLLKRENDGITSLSAALALILLLNPYAAADVGLQLSFAAMAGILLLGGPIRKMLFPGKLKGRFVRVLLYPVNILASSAAVMVFTVPLMALHFGRVSLLAPLTNALIMWAVSLCFGGGFAACAVSLVCLPLGRVLAWLSSWLARYIFVCARLVDSLGFSSLYLDDKLMVWWLVLVYLLFFLGIRARASKLFRLGLPAALSVLTLCLALGMTRAYYTSGEGFITVLDVGQGQSISVFSGDTTVMIDCGSIYSADNAGDTAGGYLLSSGRSSLDFLLLTHLHADHANGVTRLMSLIPVKTIAMPIEPNDDDGLLEEILDAAEQYGTEVRFIGENTELNLGGIGLTLYEPGKSGDANERCVMAKVSLGDYDMLVTGDGSKPAETELLEKNEIQDIELLIAGHHGSRYASGGKFLESIGADTAVISVGYNTYGHPTNETLERLAAYGYNVYRTDLNGNIEIRIA